MNGHIIMLLCIQLLCIFNWVGADIESEAKSPFDRMNIVQNELTMLDDLIAATKKSLASQLAIREMVVQYKIVHKLFVNEPNNKEYLFGTVKTAKNLLEAIQNSHLTHNFDPEFLNELTLLSQIGSKRNTPKN